MIDWTAIGTIIAILSAISAIVALLIELRMSRIALGTSTLLSLADQMDCDRMRHLRRTAAQNLLGNVAPNHELGEVLNFFAQIAFLYEMRAINRDLTYKQFSWWAVRWWHCGEDYVRAERTLDPTGWMTLERVAVILKEQEEKDGYKPVSYQAEALKTFLEEEAALPRIPVS